MVYNNISNGILLKKLEPSRMNPVYLKIPQMPSLYEAVLNTKNWSSYLNDYLQELQEWKSEYQEVKSKVSSIRNKIYEIDRVENPFLFGCYELKKLEYRYLEIPYTEKELFHCTAKRNVSSIVTDNLDWRRSNRCKFGQGVSFSPSVDYANTYANRSIGSDRVIVICDVLVGRSVTGNYSMHFPPEPYDTSDGNSMKVYVKYNDHEFYPKYIVYYIN